MNECSVLLRLQPCQTLLQCHTPQHFPFLALHNNRRLRTKLHNTLARLIFQSNSDELTMSFRRFMEPTLAVLRDLIGVQPAQLRDNAPARDAFMGVCRDLRGICQACTNKRTYIMLFEALYPTYFPIFARAAARVPCRPGPLTPCRRRGHASVDLCGRPRAARAEGTLPCRRRRPGRRVRSRRRPHRGSWA